MLNNDHSIQNLIKIRSLGLISAQTWFTAGGARYISKISYLETCAQVFWLISSRNAQYWSFHSKFDRNPFTGSYFSSYVIYGGRSTVYFQNKLLRDLCTGFLTDFISKCSILIIPFEIWWKSVHWSLFQLNIDLGWAGVASSIPIISCQE